MTTDQILQNYKAARELLLAAKQNYLLARRTLRRECPDQWATIRETEASLRIGPLTDRKKYNAARRKAIADAVNDLWDMHRSEDANIAAVSERLAALNIWSSTTTDHRWTILSAAQRLGLSTRRAA